MKQRSGLIAAAGPVPEAKDDSGRLFLRAYVRSALRRVKKLIPVPIIISGLTCWLTLCLY